MSLGTIVSEPFTTPFDNQYADGISGWWRWDPTPGTELSTSVAVTFDAAWAAGPKNSAGIALNRWAQFSNLSFGEPVGVTQADLEAAAEIVVHLTVGANIGNFGGYSGTPGEALGATVQNVNGDNVLVGDTGQVHTYIASDANLNGVACFDAGGNLTTAGFELVMHEIGHAIGLTAFGFASVAEARSFAANVGADVVFAFAGGEQLIVEKSPRPSSPPSTF
jgi:hypothetical protein